MSTSVSENPIFYTAPFYGSGGDGLSSVAVADVNGDGKLDLVVTNGCTSTPCSGGGSVSVLLGNGDGTFKTPVSYSSDGNGPTSVVIADVNGDGKLDLVVANGCDSDCNDSEGNTDTDGNVAVLLGNGDGTFQAAVKYDSGGEFTSSVAVADVNGDGKLDLVVANECILLNCEPSSLGGVSVLLGNGNGTFRTAVSYSSGGEDARSVVVADVNGDGELDLLVANPCDNTGDCANSIVSVLLGNGDGTFRTAVTYGSGGRTASSVAVADANKDGKPDLLVANECNTLDCTTGTVGVLLGNGDGTFRTAVTYGSGGYSAASVVTEDVNGDGRLDLVVANRCDGDCTNGTVGVLLGNGDGTFQAAKGYGSGGDQPQSVVIADVNGDGKFDVLVGNICGNVAPCTGLVGVLLGNGDGTFQAAPNYSSGGASPTDTSVAVADVNGDGKLDLLVANECGNSDCSGANGTVGVLLGNGDGTFQAAVSYSSGGEDAYSVSVADVNGDGNLDLLVANACGCVGDSTVGVLLGNGDGTFRAPLTYDTGGLSAKSVAVADVNGDGKSDLLVANSCANSGCTSGTVSVLLGNGDGTFRVAVNYAAGGIPSSVTVSDVNGDGKPDLLVANPCANSGCTSGTVGVLLGNGDGTFQTPTGSVTPPGVGNGSLAVADFNGDGKLDIAFGGVLLLGNGDGTFQAPLSLGATGTSMVVGDFNRDGKPDLADAGITVLLNIAPNFRYATTTALTSSLNGERFGQPVTFTAMVAPVFNAGVVSGDITFYDGTTALEVATLSGGAATFTTSALTVGVHQISAAYGGNSDVLPSTSRVMTQVVKQASATVTLGASSNPSYVNQVVMFTATVSGVNGVIPTGQVKFQQGSLVLSTIQLNNGSAVYDTTFNSSGSRAITAVYSGNVNYSDKTSKVLTEVVAKYASIAGATSSVNPSTYGQAVNLISQVTSAAPNGPTGTVTFKNGPTSLGTVPLVNGSALLTKTNLPVGTLSIKATYNGDVLNNKSTSPTLSQVVSQATTTTTVTTTPNPSVVGQNVKFTATVKSPTVAPVGTVTFTTGTTTLGTVSLSGGKAILTTSALPTGMTTVTATYNGTSNFTGSSGEVMHTVN